MKVAILKVHSVWPQHRQIHQQSALLPVIDAWYAYHRTVPTAYLFSSPQEPLSIVPKLLESLSRTLDLFPRLMGVLDNVTVPREGPDAGEVHRTRVTWGGDSDRAVEFIEARTKSYLDPFLPPKSHPESSSFIWNRSSASLGTLFPQNSNTDSCIRIQLTTFACGGFSICIDFEHGLADGYTAAKFLQSWSAAYEGHFPPKSTPSWQPQILHNQIASINSQQDREALLQKARMLPTRRRDRRSLAGENDSIGTANSSEVIVQCLLYLPAEHVERLLREVENLSPIQLTDQVALVSLIWAAVNRARKRSEEPRSKHPLELHLASSFRWMLGVRDGLLGSPIVSIMTAPGTESNDGAQLAEKLQQTLNQYDDRAVQAIIYDATLRDSPNSKIIPRHAAERVEFTSVIHLGYENFVLGKQKPVFFGPVSTMPNLFVLVEPPSVRTVLEKHWYKNGVNIFFNVADYVLEYMVSDTAFAPLETYCDG